MASTSHADFGATTEAMTVAAAFPGSIRGRTILITGVNRKGIGYATAEALASQSPRCLILAGRSPAKVQECIDTLGQKYPAVDYRLLQVDLGSQQSVRAAASQILSWDDDSDDAVPTTIDLVINNAGVMWIPEHTLTPEGIELTLATNHVGHFLLTNLIMPKLLAATKASPRGTVRVINISSTGTHVSPPRFSDLAWTKPAAQIPEPERPRFAMMRAAGITLDGELVNESMSYVPMAAYSHSKTANVLYSVGLNQRLYRQHGILSLTLHPGEVTTELGRNFIDQAWFQEVRKNYTFKTPEQGAATTLVAALDPKLSDAALPKDTTTPTPTTLFLQDCQVGQAPAYALDAANAAKLWDITEAWVGEKFAW